MPDPLSLDLIADKVLDRAFPVDEEAATELQKKAGVTAIQKEAQQKKTLETAKAISKQVTPYQQKQAVGKPSEVVTVIKPEKLAPPVQETRIEPMSDEVFESLVLTAEKRDKKSWFRKWVTDPLGRPLKKVMEPLEMYFEKVTRPMAGAALYTSYKTIPGMQPGERKFIEDFNKNRKERGAWKGIGQTMKESSLPMPVKILLEVAVDPLTYIPFLGVLRIPGVAGRVATSISKGYVHAADWPFKAGLNAIKQTSESIQRTGFGSVGFAKAHGAAAGKREATEALTALGNKMTKKSLLEAGPEATKKMINVIRRMGTYRPKGDFNQVSLRALNAITNTTAVFTDDVEGLWLRMGGQTPGKSLLEARETLENLQVQSLTGRINTDELIDGALTTLGKNPILKENRDIVSKFFGDKANDLNALLERAEGKSLYDAIELLSDAPAKVAGKMAKDHQIWIREQQFGATMGALVNRMESSGLSAWNGTINRWIVAPFAEGYLGFSFYAVMNIMEEMGRSLLGKGASISGLSPIEFSRNMKGLEHMVPWDLWQRGKMALASKELGLVELSSKSGAYSLLGPRLKLPFRGNTYHPTDWLGRKYIHMSNIYSSGIRRAYLSNRFSNNLRLRMEEVGLGTVSNEEAILMDVLRNPPKDVFGVKTDTLQKNILNHIASGDLKFIKEMQGELVAKEIIKKEAHKVLSKFTNLPVGFRGAVAEAIERGDVEAVMTAMSGGRARFHEFASSVPEYMKVSYDSVLDAIRKTPLETTEQFLEAKGMLNVLFAQHPRLAGNIYKVAAKEAGIYKDNAKKIWETAHQSVSDFYESSEPILREMLTELRIKGGRLPELKGGFDPLAENYTRVLTEGTRARQTASKAYKDFFATTNLSETPDWHQQLYAKISGIWDEHRNISAGLMGEWAANARYLGRNLGMITQSIPTVPKNFGARLTKQELAGILGGGPNDLVRTVFEATTISGRSDFIAQMRGFADNVKILEGEHVGELAYRGITDDALGRVYDDILREIGLPEQAHTMLTQFEHEVAGLKQELEHTFLSPKASQVELDVISGWMDNVYDAAVTATKVSPIARKQALKGAREQAMKDSLEEMDRYFVKYGDPNVFDYMMKHIYPYWTYESQRWIWLPRMAMQHPGTVLMGTGRYADYTDTGYFPIGLGMEINPLRGTILGGPRRLFMPDYPELYEGKIYESADYMSRWGFYPNVLIQGGIQTLGFFQTGTPEYGGMLPTLWTSVLDSGIAMGVPGLSELRETFFSDRFRDYLKNQMLIKDFQINLSDLEQALEDPEVSDERKDELKKMLDKAEKKSAVYNIISAQTSLLRFYPKERRDYWENRAKAIEAMTGLTVKQQDELREKGFSTRDVVSLSPEQSRVLNFLEGSEWNNVLEPIRPLHIQEQMARQDSYYDAVGKLLKERYNGQMQDDYLLATGQINNALHYQNKTQRWEIYLNSVQALKRFEYSDVPTTWEEAAELLEQRGVWVAPPHPIKEIVGAYFEIPMPLKEDNTDDYEALEVLRKEFLASVPDNYRDEVVREILKNRTPMEQQEHLATQYSNFSPLMGMDEFFENNLSVMRTRQAMQTASRYGIPADIVKTTPEQAPGEAISPTTPTIAPVGTKPPTVVPVTPEAGGSREPINPEIIKSVLEAKKKLR
uniref:Large polyvalent protein associated domain-containing protein n=1 Tax=viral metagenome TaxID=1070528 RepID=A0A6M3KBY7_9ZZZZ